MFEPFAREGPTPVHGSCAAVEPRSDVRDRESLEDAHFDDRPKLGIDAGEPVQESLDVRDPGRGVGLEIQILRQLHLFRLTVKRTRMMDQKPAHDVGGEAQKPPGPVCPRRS